MPRYDKYTETGVKEVYFRDFDASFKQNPVTGNLATVQNEEDAKKLLRNLVLTIRGERFYQPKLGCKIWNMLFENADPVTIELARETLQQSIRSSMPIIRLIDVNIQDNGVVNRKDPSHDPNSFTVRILFSMINSTRVIDLSIPLRRVR